MSNFLDLCFAIAGLQLQGMLLCTTLTSLQDVVDNVDKLSV